MSELIEWLKERREINEAATKGPWKAGEVIDWDGIEQSAVTASEGPITWDDHGGDVFTPSNASAIADAHNSLPALLSAVESVLELADELAGSTEPFGPAIAQERRQAASMIRRAVEGELINE